MFIDEVPERHALQPLIDIPLSKNAGPGTKPLAVEIKEIQDREGKLFVTLFDKDQASFKVMRHLYVVLQGRGELTIGEQTSTVAPWSSEPPSAL